MQKELLTISKQGLSKNLLLLLCLICSFSSKAQFTTQEQQQLMEQFHSLSGQQPASLNYIQTSKGIYETGEDLWFKVYLLNGHYLTPAAVDTTLYLQLIREDTDKAVWQEKYKISKGFSAGHVYLHDTLPEGDYLLAAYSPIPS